MDTAKKETRLDTKIRDILICAVVLIVFYLLPGPGAITKDGMIVIGTFISVMYAWIRRSGGWLTLLILIFYCLFVAKANLATQVPLTLANPATLILIFALPYVSALNETGFVHFLTNKFLSFGIARKGPYFLMATFLVASFVSAALTQALLAVMAILFGMLNEASQKMGLKPYSKYTLMTGIGIAIASNLGINSVPYCYALPGMRALMASTGLAAEWNVLVYNLMNAVGFILFAAIIILITKFVFRTKFDSEQLMADGLSTEKIQFTKQMGWAVASIFVILVGMAVPALVSSNSEFFLTIARIGPACSFALGLILLCIAPDGKTKGSGIFDFGDKLKAVTDWGIIWSVSAVLFIGDFMNDATLTGIPTFLADVFRPLTNMNPIVAILIIGIVCNLITNFLNNMIVIIMFSVIAVPICGGDPVLISAAMAAILIGNNSPIALPSASFHAIYIHSFDKIFKGKEIAIWGYVQSVCFSIFGMLAVFMMYRMLV